MLTFSSVITPAKTREDIIITINENLSKKNVLFKSQAKKFKEELNRDKNLEHLKKEIEINKKYIKNTTGNLNEISNLNKAKEFFNLTDAKNFKEAIPNEFENEMFSEVSSENESPHKGIIYLLIEFIAKKMRIIPNCQNASISVVSVYIYLQVANCNPLPIGKNKAIYKNLNSVFASFRNEIVKSKEKVMKELDHIKKLGDNLKKCIKNLILKVKKKCILTKSSKIEASKINSARERFKLVSSQPAVKPKEVLNTDPNDILVTNANSENINDSIDNKDLYKNLKIENGQSNKSLYPDYKKILAKKIIQKSNFDLPVIKIFKGRYYIKMKEI